MARTEDEKLSAAEACNNNNNNYEELEILKSTMVDGDNCEKQLKKESKKKERCKSCRQCARGVSIVYDEIYQECRKIDFRGQLRKTFSLETLKKRIPIVRWLPRYRLMDLKGDVIAGFTVGLTVIPQSLAYARIAELPPQYGLYTSFMCYFVYCIFGTGKDVNIGPAAVMSLLTAEFANQIPPLAALLSLICGLIQFAMGMLNIGFLVDYISHPIINSFTTAAAITIFCSQVKKWLGLHGVPREFVQQFIWTLKKIPQTKIYDFLLGLGCMVLLYLMKRMKEIKWNNASNSVAQNIAKNAIWFISTARNAIIVVFAAGLAAILIRDEDTPLTLTGNITSGIPPFRPPQFTIELGNNETLSTPDCFKTMGIGILIVPLVGVIECIAIGKAFGKKNGYNVEANQELIALGVANVLGSFVSAYPVTGSFSRSAVMNQSGVRTTAANIVTGGLVLLALAFLTPIFFYIPNSALAAVIIMAVVDLVDFSMLKHLWLINKADLVPWFTTFLISLLFGFEYGILLGVAVSLLFLLYPWARPSIKIRSLDDTLSCDDKIAQEEGREEIVIIDINMGLKFPGVEYLQDKVDHNISSTKPDEVKKAVILDCSHIFDLDYTAAMAIKQLVDDLQKRGIKYVLMDVQPSVAEKLNKAKLRNFVEASSIKEAVKLIHAAELEDEELLLQVKIQDGKVSPVEGLSRRNSVEIPHLSNNVQ